MSHHNQTIPDFNDIENIMELVDTDDASASYEPFPSVMHALLFMLVNSPRSMVIQSLIIK